MSITDELREWAHGLNARNEEMLLAIADSIDAEHEESVQQALMGEGSVPATDENMAEHGWVRLPKDANGVPVCIGDVMEWPDTTTAEVVGVGNGTFFYVEVGENVVEWARTCDKIHHVQESVEDVLRDVVTLCHNTWKEGSAFEFYDVDDVMESGNIAEYAAKLRLAGDAE